MDEVKQQAGSRTADGNVPNVNFHDGKVHVNYYHASNSNNNVRSRSEVLHEGEQRQLSFVLGRLLL